MLAERWRRIENLFLEALAKSPSERSNFLDESCAGDDALRREVVSLLAHESLSGDFLESEVSDTKPAAPSDPLPAGERIGPYTILEPLGAGGMGELYKAHDHRLGRDVAIKFLLRRISEDVASLERFEREARAASVLNHPNICTVHDVGESEGRRYIVMELLEGRSLKERMDDGPLSVPEILSIARQVCAALQAAHGKGIVHRDIKPANIFITHTGQVKVLDFGLAKRDVELSLLGPKASAQDPTLTAAGSIMGTLAYMSPEHAAGENVDPRSDLFSLGVVLYEMSTRRLPFRGKTAVGILGSILTEPPAKPSLVNPALPTKLDRVILRALEKEPGDRYQSIEMLSRDLEDWQPSEARTTQRKWRSLSKWTTAAIIGIVTILVGWNAWPGSARRQIRSIAVLPIQNLSGDPTQDYFSDGITEELIATLAQIHDIKVISRTSVLAYRRAARPIREIGRELGVDAIIEASLQRSGNRVRITVQLIRAHDDTHLWAKNYDRDLSDVLKLESDVSQSIAREIRAQITPAEARRLVETRRVLPEAHEAYLRGQAAWAEAGFKEAVVHFQRSIQVQPDYAAPYAALSLTLNYGALADMKPAEVADAARFAARRALELDPDSPLALSAMAEIQWTQDWDWDAAGRSYSRALALSMHSLDECGCYIAFLFLLGRSGEAAALAERYVSLNPLSPFARALYGSALAFDRKSDLAIAQLRRALEINPRYYLAARRLAFIYEQSGQLQEALPVLDNPPFRASAALAELYVRLGRRSEALRIDETLAQTDVDPQGRSLIYFALGDKDRAFGLLRQAVDQHQPYVNGIAFDPAFDDLRPDPRFQELVARFKLPSISR